MIKISYCITVYNEFEEIQRLINILLDYKQPDDEICVLFDGKGPQEVLDYLESIEDKLAVLDIGEFGNNFADWKNRICEQATGDWIWNLDSDEFPHENLITNIHQILNFNPSVEAYWVPRVNTLYGNPEEITQYVEEQRWYMDEDGKINFPDFQLRLFRNKESIKWDGNVHETVKGYKTVTRLPYEEEFSIYHPKTLDRQKLQNELYAKL